MKAGPYRVEDALPDRIRRHGATYIRLSPDDLDLILPILAGELAVWYGAHRDRLHRIIHRLKEQP